MDVDGLLEPIPGWSRLGGFQLESWILSFEKCREIIEVFMAINQNCVSTKILKAACLRPIHEYDLYDWDPEFMGIQKVDN